MAGIVQMLMGAGGAPPAPPVNNPIAGLSDLWDGGNAFELYGGLTLTVDKDGYVNIWSDYYVSTLFSGSWAVTPVANIGTSFWVRFTRTANNSDSQGTSTATTGWLALSSNRAVQVLTNNNLGNGAAYADATYTIEIATDSGGGTIVSTTTGVRLLQYSSYDG